LANSSTNLLDDGPKFSGDGLDFGAAGREHHADVSNYSFRRGIVPVSAGIPIRVQTGRPSETRNLDIAGALLEKPVDAGEVHHA
jgi:hypothetical protein